MKHNLGKILFLLITPYLLYAKVFLNAPESFYQGESLPFSITVEGQNIKIPDIKDIDGFMVQSLGTSTQTNIVNGDRSDKYIKTYSITPNKSLTLPSFEIEVNGKIEKTSPKTIKMLTVSKTISNEYDLSISVDKKEVFVGESVVFTLLFKYAKNLNIVGLEFAKPTFDGFWVKELQSNEKVPDDQNYSYQKLKYILFPQKVGRLQIGALKIEAITSENNYSSSFFVTSPTKRTKIYSNILEIDVKPLPDGVKLIGDFSIEAAVDKTTLQEGEAVSYKVSIKGKGNVDDIDEVQLQIENATIYENPSQKKYNMQNNLYGGEYSKVFSILPTKNFTIPSIELQYFDKTTQTIQEIRTKSFDIEVKSLEKKLSKLEIQEEEETTTFKTKEILKSEKIVYFIFGLLVGLVLSIMGYKLKNKRKKEDETSLVQKARGSKTPYELLKIITPYIKIDENLDRMIFQIEAGVTAKEFKPLQKEIVKILKQLQTKGFKSN